MDNKLGYGEQFLILEGIKACFADKEILKMLNKRLVSTNSVSREERYGGSSPNAYLSDIIEYYHDIFYQYFINCLTQTNVLL